MKHRIRIGLIVLMVMVVAGMNSQKTYGDIIIDVQDVTLTTGGAGTVDVLISSDGTDILDGFQYQFLITDDTGLSVGQLKFTDIQLLDEASDLNYVHLADSGGIVSTPQNGPTFDEILGGDFTNDFSGNSITAQQKLLVRLDVEHVVSGGPPGAADSDLFRISLIQDGDTFFFDNFFGQLNVASTSDGLVSFSTASVPEPSMALALSMGMLFVARRRRSVAKSELGC